MFCFIAGLALGIIPIGFGIPLFLKMWRIIESPDKQPWPSVWGVPVNATLIWIVALPLLIGIIQQHIVMRHADACIKMLLFMRGQQSQTPAKPDDT